jgi:hypothetical protein
MNPERAATPLPSSAGSRLDRGSRGEKKKFRWDFVLLAAFTVAGMYHATRRPAHEVFGAIVIPILAVHLWLNRTWIGELWRRPTRSLPSESRFNRRWNVLQFAFAAVALGSGLCASQSLLPALGWPRLQSHFMGSLHAVSSVILIGIVGVHLGMHGHWIWANLRGKPPAGSQSPGCFVALVLSGIAIVFLGLTLVAPRLSFYRANGGALIRWQTDLMLVGGSMLALAMVTFGLLVRFRKGNSSLAGGERAPSLREM